MMLVGVFGTPCGGTQWTRDAFHESGLHVGHEQLKRGSEGIVCGFWAIPEALRPERLRNGSRTEWARESRRGWTALGVLVRDPMRCAETLFRIAEKGFPWHVDEPRLVGLRYWVEAHERARAILERVECPTFVLHVDGRYEDDFRAACDLLGLKPRMPQHRPRSKGLRVERPEWDWWLERDPDYAERGAALVEHYEMEGA